MGYLFVLRRKTIIWKQIRGCHSRRFFWRRPGWFITPIFSPFHVGVVDLTHRQPLSFTGTLWVNFLSDRTPLSQKKTIRCRYAHHRCRCIGIFSICHSLCLCFTQLRTTNCLVASYSSSKTPAFYLEKFSFHYFVFFCYNNKLKA